jgi:aspartyl/asparaginyl-tRNA synthetase
MNHGLPIWHAELKLIRSSARNVRMVLTDTGKQSRRIAVNTLLLREKLTSRISMYYHQTGFVEIRTAVVTQRDVEAYFRTGV